MRISILECWDGNPHRFEMYEGFEFRCVICKCRIVEGVLQRPPLTDSPTELQKLRKDAVRRTD